MQEPPRPLPTFTWMNGWEYSSETIRVEYSSDNSNWSTFFDMGSGAASGMLTAYTQLFGTHYFRAVAIGAYGESTPSNSVQIVNNVPVPAVPQNFNGSDSGFGFATWTWTNGWAYMLNEDVRIDYSDDGVNNWTQLGYGSATASSGSFNTSIATGPYFRMAVLNAYGQISYSDVINIPFA
jgi:hypothetical protein